MISATAREQQALGSVPDHGPSDNARPMHEVGLDTVPPRRPFVIHEVTYATEAIPWTQRLEELGFLPGERVEVLTRAQPGGDPLAVRVGHSTYALRRAEAACVKVRPWPVEPEAT